MGKNRTQVLSMKLNEDEMIRFLEICSHVLPNGRRNKAGTSVEMISNPVLHRCILKHTPRDLGLRGTVEFVTSRAACHLIEHDGVHPLVESVRESLWKRSTNEIIDLFEAWSEAHEEGGTHYFHPAPGESGRFYVMPRWLAIGEDGAIRFADAGKMFTCKGGEVVQVSTKEPRPAHPDRLHVLTTQGITKPGWIFDEGEVDK